MESRIEALCLLLLMMFGITGWPYARIEIASPAQPPLMTCCSGAAVDGDISPGISQANRGFALRLVGIPLDFELTAILGFDRPFVITLSSHGAGNMPVLSGHNYGGIRYRGEKWLIPSISPHYVVTSTNGIAGVRRIPTYNRT